jgi:hypothetical protein
MNVIVRCYREPCGEIFMKRTAIVLCLFSAASGAWAQLPLPVGTWIKRPSSTPPMMMVIEPANPGIKITYRMLGPDGAPLGQNVVTVVTALDGKEAPMMMDGKATGQTMATLRTDANHASTIIRMQGKELGTSRAELSPDGRTIRVENDMSAPNPSAGKQIEVWDKK